MIDEFENDEFDSVLSQGVKVEEITLANGSFISVCEYKGKFYYFDEVGSQGPFENLAEIDQMIEQILSHVGEDPHNEIVHHQKKT